MNFKFNHNQGITNITKGKIDSWDALSKATSIISTNRICKFINIAHESTLRERYTIELLDCHIWDR